MNIRIEVPVLLYCDIDVPDDARDAWRTHAQARLIRALGPVGSEDHRGEIDRPGLSNPAIYLTDRTFSVGSLDGVNRADGNDQPSLPLHNDLITDKQRLAAIAERTAKLYSEGDAHCAGEFQTICFMASMTEQFLRDNRSKFPELFDYRPSCPTEAERQKEDS